jgi:signal transduction histidine kinase
MVLKGYQQSPHPKRTRNEAAFQDSKRRLQRLSINLFAAQEEAKRRVVRELHDAFGQNLTGLRLSLTAMAQNSARETKETLGTAIDLVNQLIEKSRSLSLELRPPILDDLGLLPTLSWYFKHYFTTTQIAIDFVHAGIERRFSADVETAVYRILEEALTNIYRHANTKSANVCIGAHQTRLQIDISDRGCGFDQTAFSQTYAGSGLLEMHERTVLLGGRFRIASNPGRGTRIVAEIPLKGAESPYRNYPWIKRKPIRG